jgi:hypothetical protein
MQSESSLSIFFITEDTAGLLRLGNKEIKQTKQASKALTHSAL